MEPKDVHLFNTDELLLYLSSRVPRTFGDQITWDKVDSFRDIGIKDLLLQLIEDGTGKFQCTLTADCTWSEKEYGGDEI